MPSEPLDLARGLTRAIELHPLEVNLLRRIGSIDFAPFDANDQLDSDLSLEELFEAQVQSRITDHTARWLRAGGRGYYTISSAGHESNAAVAMGLRPTDPALLHYRSGAFYTARAMQVPDVDAPADILSGVLALDSDPISGGRHKVFGRREMSVIPQTSTISSHLPRAVGLALSIGAADERGLELAWPSDSVVVCSFGDASLNHSTAQGAINWAAYEAHRGALVPLLFVCEDNGLGISVESPTAWVGRSLASRPLAHLSVDGTDPTAVYEATQTLADLARYEGQPCILHLRTVRYMGHAGSDVESAYRSAQEMEFDMASDPIVATAQALVHYGLSYPLDLIGWYLDERMRIRTMAARLCDGEELTSAAQVMEPLARHRPGAIAAYVEEMQQRDRLGSPVGSTLDPESVEPMTLAQAINATLHEILSTVPEALIFGEDVGRKGGVYGVTRGLQSKFGEERVFDTMLDETSILGLALGSAVAGHLPVPEIQFLAYLHNAEDQLRGEGATLQFFSNAQYQNPMVLRIAGYGYQKGFGGHFHNDNSVAVLRDIPGVIVASPAHPSDAAAMLRTCAAAARVDGSVCVFLEPIALYHTADLHEEGDGLWKEPAAVGQATVGAGRTHGDGTDLTIITWGNGLYLSLRAQRRLALDGVRARVLDMRWLAPLPLNDMVREAQASGRVLIVDETRLSGGVGESVVAGLVAEGFAGAISRIAGKDSFVPLGDAANLVLVSEDDIIDAAIALALPSPD